MSRKNARKYALQSLYCWEINGCTEQEKENPEPLDMTGEGVFSYRDLSPEDRTFAEALIANVQMHRDALDALLSRHLKNWSIRQISVVDKNIMRIAASELFFPVEKEDRAVIFNEAVELSKEFGGKDSYRFVNGVLTAAAKEKNETVSGN